MSLLTGLSPNTHRYLASFSADSDRPPAAAICDHCPSIDIHANKIPSVAQCRTTEEMRAAIALEGLFAPHECSKQRKASSLLDLPSKRAKAGMAINAQAFERLQKGAMAHVAIRLAAKRRFNLCLNTYTYSIF